MADTATEPLTPSRARTPWCRNYVTPLLAVCGLGGIAFGLYLFLGNGAYTLHIPAPEPKVGGRNMQCGVYQDPADPTTKLTTEAIWTGADTQFPAGFAWGAATSSYQIEGAWNESGRGMTIWDTFAHTKGKVAGNQNGNVACDHYHLYKEDVALMKSLGIKNYRFSIAWSRILPDGTGNINIKGVMWYSALVDELLAAGIEPYVTLYHWDLPQALEDKYRGWWSPVTADAFANYADIMFNYLGDRVKHWITLNEPWCSSLLGYGIGVHAPGLKNAKSGHYLAGHNLLLAHGKAVKIYREKYQKLQKGKIGITINSDFKQCACLTKQDQAAAERAQIFVMGWFADPVFKGDYPKEMRDTCGDRLPSFTAEEKVMMKGSLDFLGLNHYTTALVSAPLFRGHPGNYYTDMGTLDSSDKAWPTAESGWLKDVPWGFRKLLVWIQKRYDDPEIYITENGVSGPKEDDVKTDKEGLTDTFRQTYMKGYISEMYKAIKFDKVKVKGYFYWSLMDNFEWADGYRPRFGMIRVNFTSQERFPKGSALMYKDMIARFSPDVADLVPQAQADPDEEEVPAAAAAAAAGAGAAGAAAGAGAVAGEAAEGAAGAAPVDGAAPAAPAAAAPAAPPAEAAPAAAAPVGGDGGGAAGPGPAAPALMVEVEVPAGEGWGN